MRLTQPTSSGVVSARNVYMLKRCVVAEMFHPIRGVLLVVGVELSYATTALACHTFHVDSAP